MTDKSKNQKEVSNSKSETNAFYMHVENGGLTVKIGDIGLGPEYLIAQWVHYGNAGPIAAIPLLSVSQISSMIELLKEAKNRVNPNFTYDLDNPKKIRKDK